MKRNIKKMALAAMLAGMLGGLTGCFIQPDPTLDPLQISDGTVPFGTVQALPTNTPTPVPQNTPTPTPDTWQSSDQSTWEDWSGGSLPTTTPKTAATVAPGAQSWQTSTQDYNAGYPVLRVGSTGSDVSDLQARLTELGYYTGSVDGTGLPVEADPALPPGDARISWRGGGLALVLAERRAAIREAMASLGFTDEEIPS